jgi:outer membrane protein assembly factor BamB
MNSVIRPGQLLKAVLASLLCCLSVSVSRAAEPAVAVDWPAYGGDAGGSHYSPLAQIAPDNVSMLKLAWSYRIEWPKGKPAAFEVTPLKVGDLVYVCLPQNDIVALDADTGAVRWKYSAHLRPWSGSYMPWARLLRSSRSACRMPPKTVDGQRRCDSARDRCPNR